VISILQAIILGIIQGITEWLPISSSGHLVIAGQLFNLNEDLSLTILLHLASLIVIIYIFRDYIKLILTKQRRTLIWIVVATIFTALIGLSFKNQIEQAFTSLLAVSIGLLFTAFLLFLVKYTEKRIEKRKNEQTTSFFDAILIGIFQGIAILPGVSRSGATISASLIRGLNRETAAKLSFMLFIPAILGATILQFDKFTITQEVFLPYVLAVVATILTSYITIKLLLRLILNKKFYVFGYYCLVLGIIVLIYSLLQN